jgi:hypothetical protein
MNTPLSNTTSIFQLALGVNAVFAIVLNHYLRHKKEIVATVADKLKQHNAEFSVKGKERHLIKYLYRATVGYRVFHVYFLSCLLLSILSVSISFYYLLKAALHPTDEISALWLTFLSIVTLLLNPVVYFLFFRLSEWFLFAVREHLEIEADSAQLIEICVSVSEMIETSKLLIARSQLSSEVLKIKEAKITIKRIGIPLIHPIRYLRKRKLDKEINEVRKKSGLA